MSSPTDYNLWGGVCKNQEGRGAYVLQGWILAESPWGASLNFGIYNCRPPSVHGEERAGDTGFPVVAGKAHAQGFDLADWLWKNRDFFGIQLVIWNRKIISRPKPWWREYDGPSPHIDHVHWELNWWGYWNLTKEIILQHLPNETPVPIPEPEEDDMDRFLTVGADGDGTIYYAPLDLSFKVGIPNPDSFYKLVSGKGYGGHFQMVKADLDKIPKK